MSRDSVEIARSVDDGFIAGVKRRDFGAGFETGAVSEDQELIAPSTSTERPTYRGREGFVEFMQTWTEDFERYSVERKELIDAGNGRILGRYRQSAIGKGSGVPVEVEYFNVWEIDNGQVVRTSIYLDRAAAL